MNQDFSFPPMLPPSTEMGALLFALLPCLQESYRPLASFAYHMTELTKLKTIPSVPDLSGLSGIDALITDKDILLRSLSFYGRMFRMPLLSTIANLLQALRFYQSYKDMIPGLSSAFGGGTEETSSPLGGMAGLFSGLGGLAGLGGMAENSGSPDLFSMLGGISPDLLSSLFCGSSGSSKAAPPPVSAPEPPAPDTVPVTEANRTVSDTPPGTESHPNPFDTVSADTDENSTEHSETYSTSQDTSGDELFDSLYSFLTPEQKEIYDKLMHTD